MILFILFTDQQIQSSDTPVYQLTNVQIQYDTNNVPTATISVIAPSGEEVNKAATGSGSVEAIFNTLEELVEGEVHILDYRVTSIGKGRDALGEAVVNLSLDGQCVNGTRCCSRRS